MNRGGLFTIDWGLLTPALILAVMSLATLLSIHSALFTTQLLYVLISFAAFLFFSHINYKILPLHAIPIYIVSIILLLFVLFLGFESRGAVRWIDIFGFRIQFSEILKPFLIISFATFLVNVKNSAMKGFFGSLCFLLPISLLIFLQPDLGNALIYSGTIIFTLAVYGFPIAWFGLGILCIAVGLPFTWHFMREYQKQRILTFLNPQHDPLGTSYNAIQATIAIGSGSFFGKGIGQGTQSSLRFLPERHTDFIFATIAESFGFIGAMLIVVVFAFLLYRIFFIFQNCDDTFRKMFCACAFFLLLTQFFVNAGMNVGLVPIVGVTLPFVSYGGSSMLSSFILLGILSSFSANVKSREVLEIR